MKKYLTVLLSGLLIFSFSGCVNERASEAEEIMRNVIENLKKEPQIAITGRDEYLITGDGEDIEVYVDYISFQNNFTDPSRFEMETNMEINVGYDGKEIREWVKDGICYIYDYDTVEKKKINGSKISDRIKDLNNETWKKFGETASVEKDENGDYVISGSAVAMMGYVELMERFIFTETLKWDLMEESVMEDSSAVYVISPDYKLKYVLFEIDVQLNIEGQKRILKMDGGVGMQYYSNGDYRITWPDFSDWDEESVYNSFLINSEYESLYAAWFLERAEADKDDIQVHIETLDDEYAYAVFENKSKLFYYCHFILNSGGSIPVFIRPERTEYYICSKNVPDDFELAIQGAYTYDYPINNYDYRIENELDEENNIQRNLIVDLQNNNLEDLPILAKRIYAECVLADQWREDYYVFADTVEKRQNDKGTYYDLSDADYRLEIDLKNKQIRICERMGHSFVEAMSIEMG